MTKPHTTSRESRRDAAVNGRSGATHGGAEPGSGSPRPAPDPAPNPGGLVLRRAPPTPQGDLLLQLGGPAYDGGVLTPAKPPAATDAGPPALSRSAPAPEMLTLSSDPLSAGITVPGG